MTDQPPNGESYRRVEEVAEHLRLPLSVLMGRVEAGDIPSRREEDGEGVHYWLSLGELGIDEWDARDDDADHVGQAIRSSFNPGEPGPVANDASWALDGALPSQWPGMDDGGAPATGPVDGLMRAEPSPRTGRPNGAELHGVGEPPPRSTPSWIRPPADPGAEATTAGPASAPAAVQAPGPEPPPSSAPPDPSPPPGPPVPRLDLIDPTSPRGDLAVMSLDARELVAGLLDRWERTLEQRIYTEQRQRFESELTARQTAVKQLQMELQTARAEHAASQAEKDRVLAEKERELADREREIGVIRNQAIEASKRRRWFRRDD